MLPTPNFSVRTRQEGTGMSAQTVLEELTGDDLTGDHVRRRVDDWSSRIGQLYKQIEDWLPNGWMAQLGAPVTMNEEAMRIAGVSARMPPTLELLHGRAVEVRIRPDVLWVIPTNGWIDFVKGREIYRISDAARIFAEPKWQITAVTARGELTPFTRERLEALLTS